MLCRTAVGAAGTPWRSCCLWECQPQWQPISSITHFIVYCPFKGSLCLLKYIGYPHSLTLLLKLLIAWLLCWLSCFSYLNHWCKTSMLISLSFFWLSWFSFLYHVFKGEVWDYEKNKHIYSPLCSSISVMLNLSHIGSKTKNWAITWPLIALLSALLLQRSLVPQPGEGPGMCPSWALSRQYPTILRLWVTG